MSRGTAAAIDQRDWRYAVAIGLELAPAIVLLAVALAFRNDYDDPVDFNRAGLVSALMMLAPQGLGWFVMGRYFVGASVLLARPFLLFLPTLLFAINTEAATECGRSYDDVLAIHACEERASDDRWRGLGAALLVPAMSVAALVAREADASQRGAPEA